eukprot:CAMPEP_0202885606 /NCGR_PEP_ID=MMETSP1391-20130828/41748_1 /ASSEMBLY_ACC=CAM_ASM_000867 /TAXON_ID=1034604 /ORGANISM="Chlamydomonas leiostraca, Strain SAG 11-49" /LENGTH=353 /DNA_ID=CAMNT_0049568857 /DNA_START=134 /DNA_END=1192 /DNA_ORIENTATION=-
MQSHASRHVASEFLKDLHPDLSEPFPKDVITEEIAIAYGRRGITKLVAVLALPDDLLPDEDERAHALRMFNALLSTQEQKTDAAAQGASDPLIALVTRSPSEEVRRLAAQGLASIAQVMGGRQAVIDAGGIPALTAALNTAPEAAAGALKVFASCNDGVALLGPSLDSVVPALVTLITKPMGAGVTVGAYIAGVEALQGVSTTDTGITACLAHGVPAALVALAQRALTGDLRLEGTAMAVLEACAAATEQVAHHADGKKAVREAGGITMLGAMLGQCAFHRPSLLKATAALMACAVEKESKCDVMREAGARLVALLREGSDPQLVPNARAALAASAEHLEARRALGDLLGEDD